MEQVPPRKRELHGNEQRLNRNRGYFVGFASRLVTPLGVLLCHHSGTGADVQIFLSFSPLQQVFTGTCRVEIAISNSGDPKLRH